MLELRYLMIRKNYQKMILIVSCEQCTEKGEKENTGTIKSSFWMFRMSTYYFRYWHKKVNLEIVVCFLLLHN